MGWTVVKRVRGSGGRVDRGEDCSQMGEGFRWEGRQWVDCSQTGEGFRWEGRQWVDCSQMGSWFRWEGRQWGGLQSNG